MHYREYFPLPSHCSPDDPKRTVSLPMRVCKVSSICCAVLYPMVTHWCWTDHGMLARDGFRDFAGGMVVLDRLTVRVWNVIT